MGNRDIYAYWIPGCRYYTEPRMPQDKAEQARLYEFAQAVGRRENAHHVSDEKRLTWWNSDFGSFVPKEYVTPELLTARYTEVTETNQKEAQDNMKEKRVDAPVYQNGTEFWHDLKKTSVNLKAAAVTGGKYIGAMMKHECSKKENRLCYELFAAMYEDMTGKTDPAKLVYPYSEERAGERLEGSHYRASAKLNSDCARAIDDAIHDCRYGPKMYNLELAAMKVIQEYGFTRVSMVLAKNIQNQDGEAFALLPDNHWAKQYALPASFDSANLKSQDYLVNEFAYRTCILYDNLGAERFELPGLAESGKINSGYDITRSIAFDNGRGFAIGHSRTAPDNFVCWQFTVEENGNRYFYWGNYCDRLSDAEANYTARVLVHMSGNDVKEVRRPEALPEAALPEGKPSVLKQIRDAREAPKPPRKEKEAGRRKNKSDDGR